MTAAELRRLQRAHERAALKAKAAQEARNAAVRQHLAAGHTHQWISDATGLSRGRISQIAETRGRSEGDLGTDDRSGPA